jgi:hypothetical protein
LRTKSWVWLVLAWCVWTSAARSEDADEANRSAERATPKVALGPLEPVFGDVGSSSAEGGQSLSIECALQLPRRLPLGAPVVVVREVPCGRGATPSPSHLEVLYRGRALLVSREHIANFHQHRQRLTAFTEAQIAFNEEAWEKASERRFEERVRQARGALRETASKGVAVLETRVTDPGGRASGFSIKLYNSSDKTLKYVTVSVVGLNKVRDVVRDPLRRTTLMTLRGIGPVEPGDVASIAEERLWSTDVVHNCRLTSLKLEFMDGSKRTFNDPENLRVGPGVTEVLFEE